ncbi:efflux transporter, RND family, MFP subunit [Desulfotomaculum nigrificans CO-1-SRB]|uniref:Efflux transporter, RND family, MFP subunit n=1 Tax=Desulfotomaculum nigrificans (strain DSM 14880 / VKM B-2319 / CO-1-SRB) TaxID=868595 RepID=F6B6E5_DESCC|nr:efflux RND transporter periplasmic adaptor subunit [Desulfotomaculum nigrificans]AEF93216.1 efflux transporter, RND family, MFP subunit [Desulfotomaculum nigrificans CO-1-SRB]
MKKHIILVTTLMVILSITMAGCSKKSQEQDKAQSVRGGRGAGTVKVAQVVEGNLKEKMTLSGTLEALNSVDLVAKTSGKVASLLVDVGSRVSAGQTLMTLEAEDLAAAVASAEANLEAAKVTYDLSLSKYQRGKELKQAEAISQSDFEENYEGAYRKAAAALKSAQAALAQSQARYNDTIIKSPISGIVTARNINVGELAGSSSPIFSISNLDKLVVLVNVNEQQVNKFAEGQKVAVKVSAVSQNPFTGIVTNIALAADPKLKAYPIKIELDNKDHKLKPGMFAEVLWENELKTLLIPREAVLSQDGKSKVFILDHGVVKERQVQTGAADGKNIVVTSGLSKGEQVIVGNLDNLKDGMKVNPQSDQEGFQKNPRGKGEEQ